MSSFSQKHPWRTRETAETTAAARAPKCCGRPKQRCMECRLQAVRRGIHLRHAGEAKKCAKIHPHAANHHPLRWRQAGNGAAAAPFSIHVRGRWRGWCSSGLAVMPDLLMYEGAGEASGRPHLRRVHLMVDGRGPQVWDLAAW
jgi:hypothetical protein